MSSAMTSLFPGPEAYPRGYQRLSSSDGGVHSDDDTVGGDDEDDQLIKRRRRSDKVSKGKDGAALEDKLDRNSPAFFLQILKPENVGIMTSYFCVGFAMYFTGQPVSYYLVEELGASSVQLSVLSTLVGLPWSFKIFYGLLSDSVSLMGYRRKPYLIIGWSIYVLVNLILCFEGRPGINSVIILSFISTCGLLLADVATDTLCVERARLESEENKGGLQSNGYIFRSCGMVIGALSGALLYNKDSWGWGLSIAQIYAINASFPLFLVLPASIPLIELATPNPIPPIRQQLIDVWKTLQLRAVWRPMAFIYTYNVLQIPNASWYNFLVEGLEFSNFQLGLLSISSAVMTFLGLACYKRFFFKTSWRMIYVGTTVLGLFFSIMQLLLVLRINTKFGISDVVFALGDNVFAAFVAAIQYLPSLVMYVTLCPEGSEGTTYALLTTISNLAGTVGSDFGSWLVTFFNTDNATLQAGDYSGVAKLTVITSFLQLSPILLVFLLPNSKEEQIALRDSGEKSWLGGFILAMTVFLSLVFTVGLNIYLLV